MNDEFLCWKCGAALMDLGQTVGRNDICPSCRAEQYVCKMCEFYDPKVANSCREPIAEVVNNKERANFCGYYKIRPNAYQPQDESTNKTAQTQLEALFGGDGGNKPLDTPAETETRSETDIAKEQLERLFGAKDSDENS